MQDFLTFKTFITPSILMFFYYLGALVIPFVSYTLARWFKRSYLKDVNITITSKQRLWVIGLFLACFFCMELFWRVLFEFFIAYFDMHDALMKMV